MSVLKVVTIVPLIAAREGIKLGHLLWRVYIPTWPNWRPGPAPGATVTTDLYRTCRPTPAIGAQGRNMSQEDKSCYSLLAFRINDSVQEKEGPFLSKMLPSPSYDHMIIVIGTLTLTP